MGIRRKSRTTLYIALLGDLVGSREVPDRPQLQTRLKKALRLLAGRQPLRSLLAAGPEITAGDEFQLLLRVDPLTCAGQAATQFVVELTEELRPTPVAFGAGLGALSTGVSGPVRELDGPCFHLARQALQAAKKEGRWVVAEGFAPFDDTVNSVLRLTGDIRRGWTDRQLEIIKVRRNLPVQRDVARKLRVSPSVVSEALQSARHDAVREAEHQVGILLDRAADPEKWDGAER
jgi:hypothetical protein